MSFETLGIMLDMSRNAVMSLDGLRDYLKILAKMGYNQLLLYTEDTYEVEGEPLFGYMRGRYSIEEMRALDEYADSLGIEVVPCIQTLSHLATISRWGKFPMDMPDTLLVGDEATYELIEKMLKTLSSCFKSRLIHIGMDEAHNLGRGKYLDKNGYKPIYEIMSEHLTKVTEITKKYGYTPMIWSDMFFRPWNGGEYYLKERCEVPKDYAAALPEGVIPVYWDYYFASEKHYDDMLYAHSTLSPETRFAGGAWTWGGFMPLNAHTLDNSVPAIRSMRKNGMKHIMITMWGDNGAECSRYAVLPSLFYISRLAAGVDDESVIKAEFEREFGIPFDDFMLLDLPNNIAHPESSDDPIYNPCKYMLYSDCFCGFLDKTVKRGEGSTYLKYAAQLDAVARLGGRYGYLFDTAAKLCRVLADKYELGVKTRAAYKNGDTEELLRLAEGEYTRLEESIAQFTEAFEYQWNRENKPYGIEVHQYRLGGLLARIKACKKRICQYVSGEISEIPELCEEILPFLAEGVSGYFNNFTGNITANIM